jgi:hypothetical protein
MAFIEGVTLDRQRICCNSLLLWMASFMGVLAECASDAMRSNGTFLEKVYLPGSATQQMTDGNSPQSFLL